MARDTSDPASAPTLPRASTEPAPFATPPVEASDAPVVEMAFDDRYEVQNVLGAGGMGEVRSCLDRRIHRAVAMKVMLDKSMSSEELRRRFLREARVQGQLEHPAIVPVHDVGLTGDGRPYFTMKRVRGMTLRQALDGLRSDDPSAKQRFGLRKLLTAFATVCQAVEFAHRRGVVHRDLKPENVILGDFGEVYVLDWGIARVLAAREEAVEEPIAEASEGSLTVPGAMMGTPQYMAPEQLAGHADARSDVYALGLLLYEIVTRQRMNAMAAESPAEGPPELLALALRAADVDPDKRISSARELYEAVDRFLDGERDEEMRRKRSLEHARAAEEAAARALAANGSTEDRTTALSAVGRALAFDPENDVAARTLVRLMTEPPRALPAEAREEWERESTPARKLASVTGAVPVVGTLLFTPFVLWIGVRSWWAVAVVNGAFLCTLLSVLFAARRWRAKGGIVRNFVLLSAAIATLSALFGPLVAVPGMAAAMASAFARFGRRRWQLFVGAVANLAVVGPMALAWIGALPFPYVFRNGEMCIVPLLHEYPPTSTLIFLLLVSMCTVAAGAAHASVYGNALADAQERLFVQAWQVRQLVPEGFRASPASSPAPSARAEAAR